MVFFRRVLELPQARACPRERWSTTCPGLSTGSFTACIAQDACDATVRLGIDGTEARFTLDGDGGDFTAMALAGEVSCTTVTVEGTQLRFACRDGGGIGCNVELSRRAFDADGLCCVDGSSCAAASACTLVAIGGGGPATTACVDRVETPVSEGAACTRTGPGMDDCAAGLYCTPLGQLDGALACRALCRGDTGCASGEVCASAGTAPRMGTCVEGCDPFDAAACGTGRSCQPLPVLGTSALGTGCASAGTGALGDLCEATGCAAGLVCARTATLELRCGRYCDDTHPCEAPATCAPLGDGALGACRD